jgi:hypothetical protein
VGYDCDKDGKLLKNNRNMRRYDNKQRKIKKQRDCLKEELKGVMQKEVNS